MNPQQTVPLLCYVSQKIWPLLYKADNNVQRIFLMFARIQILISIPELLFIQSLFMHMQLMNIFAF